jgi:pilus assembly protein Flp/PilA
MFRTLRRLCRDEAGTTAIEYALIAALVSIAAVAAFTAVGTQIGTTINSVAEKMQ